MLGESFCRMGQHMKGQALLEQARAGVQRLVLSGMELISSNPGLAIFEDDLLRLNQILSRVFLGLAFSHHRQSERKKAAEMAEQSAAEGMRPAGVSRRGGRSGHKSGRLRCHSIHEQPRRLLCSPLLCPPRNECCRPRTQGASVQSSPKRGSMQCNCKMMGSIDCFYSFCLQSSTGVRFERIGRFQ